MCMFSLIILSFLFFKYAFDTRTKIVFCDVGQGDAAYIRIHNQIDVLIDAGPDNSVLRCLSEHMPFYDRTIEMAFISHPQKDHYFGFLEIGRRYKILNMFMTPLISKNESFASLLKILSLNETHIYFPHRGMHLTVGNDTFNFVWPSSEYLMSSLTDHLQIPEYQLSKKRSTADINQYMGESSLDPNTFSLIFTFRENNLITLFTGDADAQTLAKIEDKTQIKTNILKMPHHGSKTGVTDNFLQLADPTVSVISAGKNNRYNHPSKEIVEMFKKYHKKYHGTYSEGSIVFYLQNNIIERGK